MTARICRGQRHGYSKQMLVVAANTDLGPSTDKTGGTRVSRVNARAARTGRVCAIADSFAGFAESNGGASSASLCQHTIRSLSVAELRSPWYPKSPSHSSSSS